MSSLSSVERLDFSLVRPIVADDRLVVVCHIKMTKQHPFPASLAPIFEIDRYCPASGIRVVAGGALRRHRRVSYRRTTNSDFWFDLEHAVT